MKYIDFTRPGGFPLEQETLSRLQQAYKDEFFSVFKTHLGITDDKNYLLAHATSNERGWLIIGGELIPVSASDNTTNFVRVTELREALIFRSGVRHKVYISYQAEYVPALDANISELIEDDHETKQINYYSLTDFETVTNVPDLSNIYLPLDGSSEMQGNLNLGGNRISALDVDDSDEAIIRSGQLYFGSKDKRGTIHPVDIQGRMMVDEGDTLSINHNADWTGLQLNGNLQLTGLENTLRNDLHPVLIDQNGQLTKSTGTFIGYIPLGVIALWNRDELPAGWILCDGYFGRIINGYPIPDMTSHFFDDVRYIMHVGDFNIYPTVNAGADVYIQESDANVNLLGTAADEDGTIVKYEWTYVSEPAGLAATIHTPDQPGTAVSNMQAGNYIFRLIVTDNEGATWFDEMSVLVNKPPVVTIGGIRDLTIFSGTTQTTLTANATDPEGKTLSYQWYDSANNVRSNTASLLASNLGFGNHYFKVVVTDQYGGTAESAVTVRVIKDKRRPEVDLGLNREITLPTNSIYLEGSVVDLNNDAQIYLWQKISGGTANIQSPNSIGTTISGLNEGNYVFRLTATDSDGLAGSADISVLVKPVPNVAPVLQNITIADVINNPANQQVTAIASDADADVLTYTWIVPSQLPNPGNVNSFQANRLLLPAGNHNISVYVTDSKGARSNTVTQTLTVFKITDRPSTILSFPNSLVHEVIISGPPNTAFTAPRPSVGVSLLGIGALRDNEASLNINLSSSEDRNSSFEVTSLNGAGEQSFTFQLTPTPGFLATARFTIAGDTTEFEGTGSSGIDPDPDPDDPTCFDLNSEVPLANGQSKTLAEVEVGDQLLSLNFPNRVDASEGDYNLWEGSLPDATKDIVTVKRKSTFVSDHYYHIKYGDQSVIRVTEGHPLLAGKANTKTVSWVKPKDLSKEMYLVNHEGKTEQIISIRRINKELAVGVLDVESIDNFVIAGIVVHNAEITPGGTGFNSIGPDDTIKK
ncbi:MAG: hypothetical protein AAFQ94_14345 [Bacteroidota bacterium]